MQLLYIAGIILITGCPLKVSFKPELATGFFGMENKSWWRNFLELKVDQYHNRILLLLFFLSLLKMLSFNIFLLSFYVIAPWFAIFQCVFNVYSMCIQCVFNVYSMYIQYIFNIHSIYIQCLAMYSLFALVVTYLLTYLLSYPKYRDAIASKKHFYWVLPILIGKFVSVFFITREDGYMDAWDILYQQRSPILSFKISDTPLNAIKAS